MKPDKIYLSLIADQLSDGDIYQSDTVSRGKQ